jgi:hypothetical protein
MKPLRAVMVVLASSLLAACATTSDAPPPEQPQPDGKLVVEAKSLALGVGYTWGSGTLEFAGRSQPVSVHGFTVLALGFTSVTASGGVYYLSSLDDFDGQYDAVRGGSALGEGGAGVVMSNRKGVEVRLVAENAGVTLTLGAGGVNLELEKPSP